MLPGLYFIYGIDGSKKPLVSYPYESRGQVRQTRFRYQNHHLQSLRAGMTPPPFFPSAVVDHLTP